MPLQTGCAKVNIDAARLQAIFSRHIPKMWAILWAEPGAYLTELLSVKRRRLWQALDAPGSLQPCRGVQKLSR
jgi:hypothetical protein